MLSAAYDEESAAHAQAIVSNESSATNAYECVRELINGSSFNIATKIYNARKDDATETYVPISNDPTTSFVVGDQVVITVESVKDGYLYVIDQDVSGKMTLLYPSDVTNKDGKRIDADNRIEAGVKKGIPNKGVVITVGDSIGCSTLLAIVTNKPIEPEYVKKLSNVGQKGIGQSQIQEFAKAFIVEKDSQTSKPEPQGSASNQSAAEQRDQIFQRDKEDDDEPFEYGACRLFYNVFRTQTQRNAFLARPRTIFVGIGINEFLSRDIPNLPSCVNDVTTMATLLVTQGVITENDCILLTNEQATAANIKFLFTSFLPEYLRPGDRLIVHWSSHGAMIDKDMYFIAHDTDADDKETMISADLLNNWATALSEQKLLFLFDCCSSGGAIDLEYDWPKRTITTPKALGGANISVVASSSPEEASLINRNGMDYSLASSVMIEYLANHRDVGAIELGNAISKLVDTLAMKQFNRHQTVYGVEGEKGEFIINPEK